MSDTVKVRVQCSVCGRWVDGHLSTNGKAARPQRHERRNGAITSPCQGPLFESKEFVQPSKHWANARAAKVLDELETLATREEKIARLERLITDVRSDAMSDADWHSVGL